MNADRVRPALPQAAAEDFEALDETHRAVQRVLVMLAQLLDHVDDNGPDEAARRIAAEVRSFFEGPARTHHADEDRLVFPGLLASGNEELVHHVKRLQQDHGWLEEDWLQLAPHLEAIERGYNWYDLPMLRLAVPVFTALYQEHLWLEESLIYPAARRQKAELAEGVSRRLHATRADARVVADDPATAAA